jgi:hypothetical protein
MRDPRSNDLVQDEMKCGVQYKPVGVPQADKIMHGRGKVPEHRDVLFNWLHLFWPVAPRYQLHKTWVNQHQGTKLCGAFITMHILFPFKSVCASFVDLRPFGVISLGRARRCRPIEEKKINIWA